MIIIADCLTLNEQTWELITAQKTSYKQNDRMKMYVYRIKTSTQNLACSQCQIPTLLTSKLSQAKNYQKTFIPIKYKQPLPTDPAPPESAQQRRPESPTATLTWHASKCKVHKVHQRYILFLFLNLVKLSYL